MRVPRPPLTYLPTSIRERLCGRRSLFFIGLTLLRVAWTLGFGMWSAKDLRYAAIGCAIYIVAIFITSPYRRLRAPAIGVMCGLIWSYALAEPSELTSPGLEAWPAFFTMGVLAGLVEMAYSHADGKYGADIPLRSRAIQAQRTWLAVGCQAVGTLLFVVPVAVICLIGLRTHSMDNLPLYTLLLIVFTLPPVSGALTYTTFGVSRLRALATRPVRA